MPVAYLIVLICCAGDQTQSTCESDALPLNFYHLSLHFWYSFNRSHFSIFIHKYIIFLPHSLSYTLSLYLHLPTGAKPPDRTCFIALSSVFEKTIKDIFVCLRYLYRVSLWHFHVRMYYILNQFIPSIFISALVSFLWWFQQLKILY
jgi:hypothetical protein